MGFGQKFIKILSVKPDLLKLTRIYSDAFRREKYDGMQIISLALIVKKKYLRKKMFAEMGIFDVS